MADIRRVSLLTFYGAFRVTNDSLLGKWIYFITDMLYGALSSCFWLLPSQVTNPQGTCTNL